MGRMNINLVDHRQARREQQRIATVGRCAGAFALGLLVSWPPTWWTAQERREKSGALEIAQAASIEQQARQAAWEAQTQSWPVWAAQRQAWLQVAHSSQMPLRVWHWLSTSAVHGVRWTQWQQEGVRWTVMGEAPSLLAVRDWLEDTAHRPWPLDREVAVSQSEHSKDGRIGFVLSWEDLP
jgi:hypothetical protein